MIETDDGNWRDGVRQYESVSSFVVNRLDRAFRVSDPERKEEIIQNTMIAVGHLCELLYKKQILTLDEIAHIATSEDLIIEEKAERKV